jgi:hypothetical protein
MCEYPRKVESSKKQVRGPITPRFPRTARYNFSQIPVPVPFKFKLEKWKKWKR